MTTSVHGVGVDRSVLLADVALAGSVVAPSWPLTSFVAVNPLGGLQDRSFADATAAARELFGARTHLSLADYRAEYAAGRITAAHLDRAIRDELGSTLTAAEADVVRRDLLHGPVAPGRHRATDGVGAALDDVVASWCATFVDEAHAPWELPGREHGFYRAWRGVAAGDRRLRRIVGRAGRAEIDRLPDDAVSALARSFAAAGVAEHQRVDVLRALLLRTPGWAGYARWCDDWAPVDRIGPRLRIVDLAAVRAAVAHVAPGGLRAFVDRLERHRRSAADERALLDRRVAARAGTAEIEDGVEVAVEDSVDVERVLRSVPDAVRQAIWLRAQERSVRDRILARLTSDVAPDAAPDIASAAGPKPARPQAQLVFCIDVRSEGVRRHLESLGAYETFGFAGFFGVPVRWRGLGAGEGQARCPVLVSPRHEVAEVATDDDRAYLSACAASAGLHDAFHAAKGGIASPFALAESAGWVAGPVAAARTLAPGRAPLDPTRPSRPWWRWFTAAPATAPVVDDLAGAALHSGLPLDERVLFAEAIVTTIGMAEFAPTVVLCGHASVTVNNPHASSLDCGACGGAPGGASARIAAAILNDPAVRARLVERGIVIPDDTHVVAAEHDTTADVVTILDPGTIPATHTEAIRSLRADLATAGARNAADRARRLPGRADRVRHRGRDWAQVRPEWGLAGNAAFVIGPRSMTAGTDLAGRVFLHSYVAERDPDGVALETIMTAPLVVAQWISAQYYFSTVDPDVFGAGDKMLHNPVGGVGVVVGQSGDLAVGLPLQSVVVAGQRAHDPVRLLAIVQAPLDRVSTIVERNPGLRQLVDGEWIHVVAREGEHDGWSLRLPGGGWDPWHIIDPDAAAAADLLTPLELQ